MLFVSNIREEMAKMNSVLAILSFLFIIFLSVLLVPKEGFIGNPNAPRCGLGQPMCARGMECLNGWCVGSNPPALPDTTGLPVLPTAEQQNTVMLNFRA